MSSRSPSPEPLYTLGRALGLWPTRRRPHDAAPTSRPDTTDQDKLVHAHHLFLMRHHRLQHYLRSAPDAE